MSEIGLLFSQDLREVRMREYPPAKNHWLLHYSSYLHKFMGSFREQKETAPRPKYFWFGDQPWESGKPSKVNSQSMFEKPFKHMFLKSTLNNHR